MAPVAEVTDAPRAVIGRHEVAAAVRVVIGVIVVVRIIRPVEEVPVVKVVPLREPGATEMMVGEAIAAAVEGPITAAAAKDREAGAQGVVLLAKGFTL